MSRVAPSRSPFPDFGYDVHPAFDVVELDARAAAHIPDGAPTGFKGIIAACRMFPRSVRQRGEVRLGLLSGNLPRHSDVLAARKMREDQQPVVTLPYAGRVWSLGGRFAWEEDRRLVDVDLWTSAGTMADVTAIPEHRGLTLAMGLAVGQAVMDRVQADPGYTQIELTTVPNFENGARPICREPMRLAQTMTQVLEIVELN